MLKVRHWLFHKYFTSQSFDSQALECGLLLRYSQTHLSKSNRLPDKELLNTGKRLKFCTAKTQRTQRKKIGPLDWAHFPERNLPRHWCQPAISYAAFAGAMLVKLNEGLDSMGDMRQYMVEHPGLIPLLNFSVVRSKTHSCGFDPEGSLPTQRHLTRMLRDVPNTALQFLLNDYFSVSSTRVGRVK
jgi:hypothetical protein